MANSVPTAGNYPRSHNNREAKIIETALQGSSGTIKNKTIDNTNSASFKDGNFTIVDDSVVTKVLKFDVSGATAAKYLSLKSSHSDDRVVTLPDATCTLASLDQAEVFENKSLETSCTIVDATDNAKVLSVSLSGATTAKYTQLVFAHSDDRAITFPDATDTLVGKATVDTLTNKTLTSPVVNSVQHMQASGTIASADVLQLNGTPVELIATPGAGKIIIVDEIEVYISYGSAQYAAGAGEDFTIQYATSDTAIVSIDNDNDGFLLAAASAGRIIKPALYNGNGSAAMFNPDNGDNEAIEATILSGEWATGDSDISYRISYRVVTLIA